MTLGLEIGYDVPASLATAASENDPLSLSRHCDC